MQLLKVLDRRRIQLEIWERGAGYTLASGSSACAAAAVAVRSGACDGDLSVAMPGGSLALGVSAAFELTMEGPAEKVFEGEVGVLERSPFAERGDGPTRLTESPGPNRG